MSSLHQRADAVRPGGRWDATPAALYATDVVESFEHVSRHRERAWLATTGRIADHFIRHAPIKPAE